MIPPKKCDICGDYYIPRATSHCESLAKDIECNEKRLIQDQTLLMEIILAFKERGEANAEILNAAYEYGYSISRTQPKWLDKYFLSKKK